MIKYTCEHCGKGFSQKSHYNSHNRRKTPCAHKTDKIKPLVDKKAEENLKENNNLIIENEEVTINTQVIDMDNITNKSPLRYPGGKTRACKTLEMIMKEHFNICDYDTLISPFFGGGSFEFHIQNNYQLNIIANDKFKPLYNFWNICKNNK